ncbi:hypothetical protein CLU79DRAFT_719068 [Phycomyces nitens]|nr:hypothetical protein CLU79DRAFT_719068 [Phycomyces nitens]
MNIADILNPSAVADDTPFKQTCFQLTSPPHSPAHKKERALSISAANMNGKARSRFSDLEDTIICDGVANGLTWGQISRQLPHRKRATCFNRYRTLQGIRKSRKSLLLLDTDQAPTRPFVRHSLSPTSLVSEFSPSSVASWLPITPPSRTFEDNELPMLKKDGHGLQRSLFGDLGSENAPSHRPQQKISKSFRPSIIHPFVTFPLNKHTSPPSSPIPYYRRFSS